MGLFNLKKKEKNTPVYKIFIAEDNAVYLKQMEFYFKNNFGDQIELSCFPVSEVIEVKIEHGHVPNMIILDHNLSTKYDDANSGLEAIKKFHAEHPQIELILHSGHTSMKEDPSFGNDQMFLHVEKGEGSLEKIASIIKSKIS